MTALIVIFCGVASSGYTNCYTREALVFDSQADCNNFLSHRGRWGEGFVVAYCAPARKKT